MVLRFPIKWNLGVLAFVEKGTPESPEKNPRRKDENQQQTQQTLDGFIFSFSPYLTWRDVQHIIVYSSRHAPGGVPLQQGDWVQNKAGLYVSKFYGFGLMDAGKMVSVAKDWKTVPPQLKCEIKGDDKNK